MQKIDQVAKRKIVHGGEKGKLTNKQKYKQRRMKQIQNHLLQKGGVKYAKNAKGAKFGNQRDLNLHKR